MYILNCYIVFAQHNFQAGKVSSQSISHRLNRFNLKIKLYIFNTFCNNIFAISYYDGLLSIY